MKFSYWSLIILGAPNDVARHFDRQARGSPASPPRANDVIEIGRVKAPQYNHQQRTGPRVDPLRRGHVMDIDGTDVAIKENRLMVLAYHADKARHDADIPFGTHVQLTGLHQTSLNGRDGVVRGFDASSGRYIVHLVGGSAQKKRSARAKNTTADESASAAKYAPTPDAPQLLAGTLVGLFGLQTVTLNNLLGVIRSFDADTHRYVVELTDGSVKKVRAEHLRAMDVKPGAQVFISGMKMKELNGEVGIVKGYDAENDRYVVELPHRALKKIKRTRLTLLSTPTNNRSSSYVDDPDNKFTRSVTVCNAYPDHRKLTTFLVDKVKGYKDLFDVDYQTCGDARIPLTGSLHFSISTLQVAQHAFNITNLSPDSILVLTVYRDDVNSLKASVLADTCAPDAQAQLLVFNAYTGLKIVDLEMIAADVKEKLNTNKRYRLVPKQYNFVVSDGFHHMEFGFRAVARHIHMLVLTGIEPGLRGEPKNLGVIAHEVGAWSLSEQLSRDTPIKTRGYLRTSGNGGY